MSKKGKKSKKTRSKVATIIEDTKELLKDWVPPFICSSALKFMLDQLDSDSLLNLSLVAIQQAIAPNIFSGFRLDKLSINDSINSILSSKLNKVLYESNFLKAALFIVSYPNARWYRWSNLLDKIEEKWIIENWRELFRIVNDPSILISMSIDSRKRINSRGRRLLSYDSLFKDNLLVQSNIDQEIENLKKELEQSKISQNKYREKQKELKEIIKEKDRHIRELYNKIETLKKDINNIELRMEEEFNKRLSLIFEDQLSYDKDKINFIWDDILHNKNCSIQEKVERALKLQAKIDLNYGTKTYLKQKQYKLKQYINQINFAISESINPAKELFDVKKLIEDELAYTNSIVNKQNSDKKKKENIVDIKQLHKTSKTNRTTNIKTNNYVNEIPNLASFVLFNKDVCQNTLCVVDGYNAIKSAYTWAQIEKRDFKLARKQFCKIWENKIDDWYKIELVFDGTGQSFDIKNYENLTIIFTDSRYNDQRADMYIVEFLKKSYEEQRDIKRLLITADTALRSNCKKFCDYFVDPRWAMITYLSLD